MILRLTLTGVLAFMACACTIDGPEPGSTDVMAEMERQDRVRQREEEHRRLCNMLDRNSERYEQQCRQRGEDNR